MTDFRVVQVPSLLQIHPDVLRRYEDQREELRALLTPEAFAKLELAEAEGMRAIIEGEGKT